MRVFNSIGKILKLVIIISAFLTSTIPVFAGEGAQNLALVDEDVQNSFTQNSNYFGQENTAENEYPAVNTSKNFTKGTVYIKDVKIEGANVVKPDYILKKINLNRGDRYDRNVIQKDLKTIYDMGFFTDKMKAVPTENSDGSVS